MKYQYKEHKLSPLSASSVSKVVLIYSGGGNAPWRARGWTQGVTWLDEPSGGMGALKYILLSFFPARTFSLLGVTALGRHKLTADLDTYSPGTDRFFSMLFSPNEANLKEEGKAGIFSCNGSRISCTIPAPGMAGTDSLMPHWVCPAPPGHLFILSPFLSDITAKWSARDPERGARRGWWHWGTNFCVSLAAASGWAHSPAGSGGSSFSHPQHCKCHSPALLSAARHNPIPAAAANLFTAAFVHKLMEDQNIKMFVFD